MYVERASAVMSCAQLEPDRSRPPLCGEGIRALTEWPWVDRFCFLRSFNSSRQKPSTSLWGKLPAQPSSASTLVLLGPSFRNVGNRHGNQSSWREQVHLDASLKWSHQK